MRNEIRSEEEEKAESKVKALLKNKFKATAVQNRSRNRGLEAAERKCQPPACQTEADRSLPESDRKMEWNLAEGHLRGCPLR